MSGKKAKEERQAAKTVAAQFTITAFADGSLTVDGPIENFILFRSMMCSAEKAVLDMMREQNTRRILSPSPGLSIAKPR